MAEYRPTPEAVLNYLYGLLDEPESERVSAWLATPAGEATRLEAERARELIAAAAKDAFPQVRFERPTLPLPAPRARSNLRRWAGWTVAVGVLLTAGFPFARHAVLEQRGRREVDIAQRNLTEAIARQQHWLAQRQQEFAAANQRVAQARQKLNAVEAEFDSSALKFADELGSKQLSLVISGPESLRAGATNEFRIQTLDGRNQPTPATVVARVKDRQDHVFFEERLRSDAGVEYRFQLPADIPLTPQRELYLEVTAQGERGPKSEIREQLQLAVPDYFTHLTTDKPMYQPGETVRFRSLTVDRFSLTPAPQDFHVQYLIQDPKQIETEIVAGRTRLIDGQSTVLGPDGQPLRGVGAGEWQIPPDAPGGEYALVIREAQSRFPESKRRFLVNQYRPEQIEKLLEWSRRSYGPGDEVIANCKAIMSNGAPLAGRSVTASAIVDGQPVPVRVPAKTDEAGRVAIRFELPKQIEVGAGSLSIVFSDGANSESLIKPIPISLKKLDIEFFPEGGDLIAGTANRVYFQIRTTLGKAADAHGRIVDSLGREVARIATLTDDTEPGINQGLGKFELTPEFGQKYRLVVDNPVGIEGDHMLPDVRPDGVVLTSLREVTADPEPIQVRVASMGAARNLLVGAYARGRLLDHRRVSIAANSHAVVALKPEAGVGGVTRITVFEEHAGSGSRAQLKPVAERLVYRKPAANLLLSVKPDRPSYSPGDSVRLRVSGNTESEKPTAAVLYLGVVNQSVVTMADEKTWRSLPTHFLLTSEVRQPEELEHADVLLGDHPKSAIALDLLLGTQGWRRFIDQLPGVAPEKAAEVAERALVAHNWNVDRLRQTSSLELGLKKLEERLAPTIETARHALSQAEEKVQRLEADPQAAATASQLSSEVVSASGSLRAAEVALDQLADSWRQTQNWLLPAIGAIGLLTAIVAMIVGIARGMRWQMPAAVSLSVAAIGVALLAKHAHEDRLSQAAVASGLAAGADAEPKVGEVRAEGGLREFAEREDRRDNLRFGGQPGAGGLVPAAPAGAAPRPMAPAPPPAGPATPASDANAGMRIADKDILIPESKGPPAPAQDPKAAGKPMGRGAPPVDQRLPLDARQPRWSANDKKIDGSRPKLNQAERGDTKSRARLPGQAPASRTSETAPVGGGGGGFAIQRPAARGGQQQDLISEIRKELLAPPPEPFVVRQYAHRRSASTGDSRSDFTETLFWHPALVLPAEGAEIAFDLSDAVGQYRVLAAGHTLDGRLGSITTFIEARRPLSLEPKLPVEITSGDRVDVALSVVNDSAVARSVAVSSISPQFTMQEGQPNTTIPLAPEQRLRQLYRLKPNIVEGIAALRFDGTSDGAADSITVQLPVVANGFPIVGSISDSLERVARHPVVLPESWVPGTLHCQLSVFPSTLSELQRGLDGLLREPGGCFEQTSTTNYPNTLILEYLRESDQAEPEAMQRARDMLQRGFAQLTSFEVASANRREGFEWFGQAPAHEALTAYGLMQFRDMARVSDVDPLLLRRTRDYLLSRRDGQGGFQRNPRALDTFGRAPEDVTNAYIVWALTEGGQEDDVTVELDALAQRAKQSKDPYFLALVANALLNRDRHDEAIAILRTLALSKDGFLDGAQTSITGSSGRTLQIETTALAVLGWLKANRPAEFAASIRSAVTWIGQQRGGYGGFGSTQSTILALKALIAFTRANKQAAESGTLVLYRGDQLIGRRPFTASETGELTIQVPNPEQILKPGKNELRIEIDGKNSYPYTLTWSYRTAQPPSAGDCPVRLTTQLETSDLAESDATQLRVKVENVSGRGQGMTVAIIGLPAGLKLPDDFKQLREMARLRSDGTPGPIGAFEVRGRELILYWRDLAPNAKIELSIDVRGHVPGEYTGPASRAYLYYNSDAKHWAPPLKAIVRAAQ